MAKFLRYYNKPNSFYPMRGAPLGATLDISGSSNGSAAAANVGVVEYWARMRVRVNAPRPDLVPSTLIFSGVDVYEVEFGAEFYSKSTSDALVSPPSAGNPATQSVAYNSFLVFWQEWTTSVNGDPNPVYYRFKADVSHDYYWKASTGALTFETKYVIVDLPVSTVVNDIFNQTIDIVFERKIEGGQFRLNYYLGKSDDSGDLPLMFTAVTVGSMPASALTAPSASFDQLTFYSRGGISQPASASSLDVFILEHNSGSLPYTSLTRPLSSSGIRRSFVADDYADIEDFIDAVRPLPNNLSDALPTVLPGFYYPPTKVEQLWTYGGYNHIHDFPFSYFAVYSYDVNADFYYFDYERTVTENNAFNYWYYPNLIPDDDYLEGPYVTIGPATGGLPGQMMGPLTVGGSLAPPTLTFNLGTVKLKYSTTRAPSNRRGFVVYASSGSPHVSMEPVWPTSSWHLPGDIWFTDSTGSNRGLYVADYSGSSTGPTGSIVPWRILTTLNPDAVDGGEF